MTASGHFSWPLPGSYMAAPGQFLVAAATPWPLWTPAGYPTPPPGTGERSSDRSRQVDPCRRTLGPLAAHLRAGADDGGQAVVVQGVGGVGGPVVARVTHVESTGGQPDPNVTLQLNERYGVYPAEGAPLI